jgi:hypothetical protein
MRILKLHTKLSEYNFMAHAFFLGLDWNFGHFPLSIAQIKNSDYFTDWICLRLRMERWNGEAVGQLDRPSLN